MTEPQRENQCPDKPLGIKNVFNAGGVLFIAISDWPEWYYNKYGLKSVTWHNEIRLINERKGDDND